MNEAAILPVVAPKIYPICVVSKKQLRLLIGIKEGRVDTEGIPKAISRQYFWKHYFHPHVMEALGLTLDQAKRKKNFDFFQTNKLFQLLQIEKETFDTYFYMQKNINQ